MRLCYRRSFILPQEPCNSCFIMDACTLCHVLWTVDTHTKNTHLPPLKGLEGPGQFFIYLRLDSTERRKSCTSRMLCLHHSNTNHQKHGMSQTLTNAGESQWSFDYPAVKPVIGGATFEFVMNEPHFTSNTKRYRLSWDHVGLVIMRNKAKLNSGVKCSKWGQNLTQIYEARMIRKGQFNSSLFVLCFLRFK